MQNLPHWKTDTEKTLLRTHSQNTWAKILANHFTEGYEDIPFDTAKKYFKGYKIGQYTENGHYEIKLKEQ